METLTLYQLNTLVRGVIQEALGDEYWVEAEIAEARVAQNGHCYLDLVQKDDVGNLFVAKARANLWARNYQMLAPLFERATGEKLRAGLKVRVLVNVEFHELYGYALNIIDIDPTFTMGDLVRRRHEILAQLEADGILHDNQELPLPALVKRIAVVSSAGAAGYGDFCNQLAHNDYGLYFELRLFSAVMQGANVEESVLAALAAIAAEAERWHCVVVIRGGGATSDLSDFDSYPLAAAVAQMPLPVIVGIGHERDVTVLDAVAHTRVKTPTAAAAFLIDHGAQQLAILDALHRQLTQHARLQVEQSRQRLNQLTTLLPHFFSFFQERQLRRLVQLSMRLANAPRQRLLTGRHRVELLHNRLSQHALLRLQNARFKVQSYEQRLATLDPILMLRRGYSLTYTSDGRLIRSINDFHVGDTILTRVADGIATATVREGKSE